MFLISQNRVAIDQYSSLLSKVASLSKLFSENDVPYLNYRATENLFCYAFRAENLTRTDCSIDAIKDKVGIGIKTFLFNNGQSYQKIAEFNKDLSFYTGKDDAEVVRIIAELRNKRLEFVDNTYSSSSNIYHLITRKIGLIEIYEEFMNPIEISNVQGIRRSSGGIYFSDGVNEYNFNLSKSTLQKKFKTLNPLLTIPVSIVSDPIDLLSKLQYTSIQDNVKIENQDTNSSTIYLPLYSPRDGKVHAKSGLNQWKAGGRARHYDEVYIPIPAWIHRVFEGFFPYMRDSDHDGDPFKLILPDGTEMEAKICQQGGKALMSNPNKHLGEWLLRRVLQVKPFEELTYEMLQDIGVDSVYINKLSKHRFKINFASMGSYEHFSERYSKGETY